METSDADSFAISDDWLNKLLRNRISILGLDSNDAEAVRLHELARSRFRAHFYATGGIMLFDLEKEA